ncbi:BQ2448_2382 [Microbotryum intermedium]|uniref:Autophagy-related protein 14 n=1 Tax=Microbotryum intermedium TaxID=269621 RepID=A0A238F604_9BASI|nr:BQ2448_2382 [Microbotryum intermedium]
MSTATSTGSGWGATPSGSCAACHRGGSNRLFYCAQCVEQRLADHYSRRQHAQRLTHLSQARASALLDPPPASSAWPVSDERRQKADKWAVAVQAKQLALANENIAATLKHDRILLQQRRITLTKRRENLIKARRLLAQISPSHHTATLAQLVSTHQDLLARLEQVSAILTHEALVVFAFQSSATPSTIPSLPTPVLQGDPFQSTLASTTKTAMTPPLAIPPAPPRSPEAYTLANLPLPPLSVLPTLPIPYLNALLSHLVHLTRLIAIYYDLQLPFTPIPSLYGPGRPGIKACLSNGVVYAGVEAVNTARADETKASASGCWQLFLSSTTASPSSTAHILESDESTRCGSKYARPNNTTTRALETWTHLQDGSSRRTRSTTFTEVTVATSQKMRNLMVGIVALAFDWEWIARVRGKGIGEGVQGLDDWARLIKEATRVLGVRIRDGDKDACATNRTRRGQVELGFTFAQAVDYYWARQDASIGRISKTKNVGGGKHLTGTKTKERWNKVEREHGGERGEEEREAEGLGEEDWDLV